MAGAAVFQHPSNPGFPHKGWIMRHYGFLGVSWPHEVSHTIQPGESFELKYRLLVHRGSFADAHVADRFDEYLASQKDSSHR